MIIIVIWESVLILSATLLFYRLLITHIRTREKNREFLEIVMLSFTHKLGNFISSQRVNLSILQERYNDAAVERLAREYRTIHSDVEQLIKIMEGFKHGTLREEERIDLKLVVDNLLSTMKDLLKDREIAVSLTSRRCEMIGIRDELEIALYLLIENAVKYSSKLIQIRLSRMNNTIFFVIRNDQKSGVTKGSGMGLSIVEKLCRRYRIRFKVSDKGNHFSATLAIDTGLLNRLISFL